jgi:phosphoribosylanthranilate isomerase
VTAPFVKICGLTHAADVASAVELGADRLGFVVDYPLPVPWNLSPARARELMSHAGGRDRVAVVGGAAETILRIVGEVGPEFVQLHADEPADVVATVARSGVPVIKALRALTGQPVGAAAQWIDLARRFAAAGATEILLDSRSADRPAGTGEVFNWEVAAAVVEALADDGVPVLLAGGLTPGNVADAIARVHPDGVDVISGVAGVADRKDPARMAAFIAAAHRGANPPRHRPH